MGLGVRMGHFLHCSNFLQALLNSTKFYLMFSSFKKYSRQIKILFVLSEDHHGLDSKLHKRLYIVLAKQAIDNNS